MTLRLRPGYVLPMPLPRLQSNGFCANAGVAVDAVAAAACGGLVCRCLCPCGSVYAQCGSSRSQIRPVQAECRGEERKIERGRDSARVRKGRQAIRWRMAGIVQRCSIFKLSCQFRDWIILQKERESVEEGGRSVCQTVSGSSNFDSAKLTLEGCLTFLTLSEFVLILRKAGKIKETSKIYL